MILKEKVVIITGAARGIGREHALAFARHGAKVLVNDLGGSGIGEGQDAGPAEEVAREIVASGGEAIADGSSVANWEAADQMVERAVSQFGRLDIIVNNAGICRPQAFGSATEADWDLLADVNLKGTAALMNAAARHWRKAGPERGRAIINTCSPAGPHPLPEIGFYSATKAGVAALTQAGAADLAGFGVRVNAIAPMARTRLTAPTEEFAAMLKRTPDFDPFDPSHVSQLVIYLASDLCSFTGRLLGVWGNDIFLYREWSADRQVPRPSAAPWTPESISEALHALDIQERRYEVALDGRFEAPSPGDPVLAALADCTGKPAQQMIPYDVASDEA